MPQHTQAEAAEEPPWKGTGTENATGPWSGCREPCLSAWADELLGVGREARHPWKGCGLLWAFALVWGRSYIALGEGEAELSVGTHVLPAPLHTHPKGHQAASKETGSWVWGGILQTRASGYEATCPLH